jgi:hypothetical protein
MAFTLLQQGNFVSTGAPVQINLPGSADYFTAENLTQIGMMQTVGRGVKFEWFNQLTAPMGQTRWYKGTSSDAINATVDASGGFTYYFAPPLPGPPVVGTAITAANPAVVTMTNTFVNGQNVRLYGTTGMLQIAGMEFTISSVSSTGFTLLGLNSAAFSAPATAVTARLLPQLASVEPEYLYITGISQAPQAVVTVSIAHNYVVNQLVHFSVPSSFGMTQINQLTGEIVAVTAYTMTVNINSTAFTPFAFPASSLSPVAPLFATLAPAGQRNGYNVSYVPFHSGQFTPFMLLAAGPQSPAGSAGDVIVWQAWKQE